MADNPSSSPRRVLVVDSHNDCRDSLVALLALQGYDVRGARDAFEAVATAVQFEPDVVLLDLALPAMSGLELAKALRNIPTTANTFIAAVTGYGTLADRRKAADAGIDLHLVKPVALADLLPALHATRQAD